MAVYSLHRYSKTSDGLLQPVARDKADGLLGNYSKTFDVVLEPVAPDVADILLSGSQAIRKDLEKSALQPGRIVRHRRSPLRLYSRLAYRRRPSLLVATTGIVATASTWYVSREKAAWIATILTCGLAVMTIILTGVVGRASLFFSRGRPKSSRDHYGRRSTTIEIAPIRNRRAGHFGPAFWTTCCVTTRTLWRQPIVHLPPLVRNDQAKPK